MYINNNIKVDKRSPRGIPLYYIKFQKKKINYRKNI